MPRRPSKSKGANKSSARPINRAEGKIKRWDKLSDIPMDEEDQCMFVLLHHNIVY
jgi:U3 small nucleolar RNA-associated protein 3